MKVGLVRRGYSASGGAERYLLRFAEGLVRAGHSWQLFSDVDWPVESLAKRDGTQIRLQPRNDSPLAFADALRAAQPREHCDCLFSLERVWECDAYRAGDGVHAAWLDRRAAAEGGRLFGLPDRWRRRRRKHREILELERALYDPAAAGPAVIANSQLVADEIVERFDTPAERLHRITNGYDAPATPADHRADLRRRLRAELGLGEHEVAVLFTGSGWERKGLTDAIEAIGTFHGGQPTITLLVAGSGRSQPVPGHPESVRFLGPVASGDMPALYESADLFVLPTLYDPFSNASLEAAAHGLPVITTPANGFSELLPDDHSLGTVVPVGHHHALAAAIATWATPDRQGDDHSRDQQRDIIRQWATQWSVEKNVRETLAVLEEVAGG